MSRTDQWRKIFGYAEKQKINVRVGDKVEDLTGTQAIRFQELTEPSPADAERNPLRDEPVVEDEWGSHMWRDTVRNIKLSLMKTGILEKPQKREQSTKSRITAKSRRR